MLATAVMVLLPSNAHLNQAIIEPQKLEPTIVHVEFTADMWEFVMILKRETTWDCVKYKFNQV